MAMHVWPPEFRCGCLNVGDVCITLLDADNRAYACLDRFSIVASPKWWCNEMWPVFLCLGLTVEVTSTTNCDFFAASLMRGRWCSDVMLQV